MTDRESELKPEYYFWKCNECGAVMDTEEEIGCWECNKGEMIFVRKEPPIIIKRIRKLREQLTQRSRSE